MQAALDHRAKRTWGQSIGAALRFDRLILGAGSGGGSGSGGGADSGGGGESRVVGSGGVAQEVSAAALLDAFERKRDKTSTSGSKSTHSTSATDDAASGSSAASLVAATTPAGKVRGWIHASLNRGELGERLAALTSNHREMLEPGHRSYYETGVRGFLSSALPDSNVALPSLTPTLVARTS